MKIRAFWDVAPCNLAVVDYDWCTTTRLRGAISQKALIFKRMADMIGNREENKRTE
jgi:hypothetical protein